MTIYINMNSAFQKLIFLSAAILIFSSAEARKIPGQIVDKQGNTIDVVFNIPFKLLSSVPNYEKMQYRIAYYDETHTKKILRPDEAEEIVFVHNREEIRMLSRLNSIHAGSLFYSNTHIFLRLVIDGKLKLFNYYYTQSSPGMYNASTGGMTGGVMYTVDNYVLQKDNGELMQPRGLGFRKDMVAYLQDCPKVARMVEAKQLRRPDMEIIVQEYNAACGD